MKYTFVGDLHGKWEIAEDVLQKDGHIVFVGDYVDDFTRKVGDFEKTLMIVLDAVEQGKATALYGNHELSYILPELHRCSGYNVLIHDMINCHMGRIKKNLKPMLVVGDNFYITHAGIHPLVWAQKECFDQAGEFSRSVAIKNPAHWVGKSRGGWDTVGGIWWCDFNREFEPVPGINQIFGHSSKGGDKIRMKNTENSVNFCIDCLNKTRSFLELDI